MEDGKIAECYAKAIADVSRETFPGGFEDTRFIPGKLDEPKATKKPARIFVGSMADVFGHWNQRREIDQVLSVVKYCQWHDFQFLTKNAPRLRAWDNYPSNAWIGASVPPSGMNGQTFTPPQQRQMLFTTLQCLKDVNASIHWMSVEPLAWDCADVFDAAQPKLDWIVIGAATRGKDTVYQPKPEWVRDLVDVAREQGTRIFFKGNLRGNPAAEPWLEEMPASYEVRQRRPATPVQASLF
jgi:protein gp37